MVYGMRKIGELYPGLVVCGLFGFGSLNQQVPGPDFHFTIWEDIAACLHCPFLTMDAINEEVDDGNAEAISFEIVNIYHFLPLPTIMEEKEEEYFESIRNLPLQTILEEEEEQEEEEDEDEGETSGGCSIAEAETSVSAGPASVPGLSEAFADETQADKKPAEAPAKTADMEEERTNRQTIVVSLLVILFFTVVVYSFMKCSKTKKTN